MWTELHRYFRDRPRLPWWFAAVPLVVPALAALLALQLVVSTPMDATHAWQVAFETWRKPCVAAAFGFIAILVFPLGRGRWRFGLPLHVLWFSLQLFLDVGLPGPRPEPPFGRG